MSTNDLAAEANAWAAPLWREPLVLAHYDRRPELTVDEHAALVGLGWHTRQGQSYDATRAEWAVIERLFRPLNDARLSLFIPATRYHERCSCDAVALILHGCSTSQRAFESPLPSADLAEVVWLYGLRVWVEQSYKQVKGALGWAEYQVRSDLAIRRHWALVFLAFSFCWWVVSELEEPLVEFDRHEQPDAVPAPVEIASPTCEGDAGEKNRPRRTDLDQLAGSTASGAGLAGAVRAALALLAGVVGEGPTGGAASAAGLALDREAALPLLPMTTNYW